MLNLLYSYITNSLNITFFIILLLLLEPFLKKHFSAVCLYRIWVVLLIGLLIPMRFEFTKALFYISSPRITIEDSASYDFNMQAMNQSNNTLNKYNLSHNQSMKDSLNNYHNNTHGFLTYFFTRLLPTRLSFILQNRFLLLGLIWIIGVIFLLTVKGIQYYRYIKLLKRFMSPLSQNQLQEVRLNINKSYNNYGKYDTSGFSWYRDTSVCKCSVISSPMTLGILKPTILLPNETYSKKDMQFILLHELVHIRRRDSLIKLVRLIVLSLNWYNPFCYVLSGRLDNWCEVSCDKIVLQKSTKSDCLDYSRLLLKCASIQPKRNAMILTNLYGGKNNMKHRLCSIMDQKNKHSGKLLIILVLGVISTTAIVTISNHKNALASNNETAVLIGENTSDDAILNNVMITPNEKERDSAINEGDSAIKEGDSVIKERDSAIKESGSLTKESGSIINDTTQEDFNITDSQNDTDTDSLREALVNYAIQAENTAYVWGGNDLNTGVDCSGLIQAVYKKIGYDLPRLLKDQLNACEEVSFENLLPGDIIFYASSDDNTVIHAGIYIGDNKIIHAKNSRDNVIISDINYRPPYCAGRIITD